MPRARYQMADGDVTVVHRWVQAKFRTIDAQDKRDMRRRHPDVDFDWKKITRQLAEKREVCRRYRSRRRTARTLHVREPFYGVIDPVERAVYVNDPSNIAGTAALLDAIIAGRL